MKIVDVEAFPCSFNTTPRAQVTMGVGTALKRDTVIIKVTTDEGLIGWGESHHGRAPGAVARLAETTVRDAVVGQDPTDVVGAWDRVYQLQLGSHGMGAGASIAMSGVDMALWDIRGKAVGWPLYKLLGGAPRPIRAYAGGVAFGYAEPGALLEEIEPLLKSGYQAVKLRLGDRPDRDLARVRAVRHEFGPDLTIMTDANTAYSLNDAKAVMPALADLDVYWLEEPFPAHDHRSYAAANTFSTVPLAAGENHYTRFEFHRLIEDGVVRYLQPDLSKTGGVTEAMRIAALGSAWKLSFNPHTATSGINMAATVHLLASVDNAGFFEGDVSHDNLFRDELVNSDSYTLAHDGTVTPGNAPGLGVTVDEDFIRRHPVIEGAGYR